MTLKLIPKEEARGAKRRFNDIEESYRTHRTGRYNKTTKQKGYDKRKLV